MVNEMSLRLEKLVEDIKEETILWPIEDAKNSAEEEAAWARIGVKHKMTGPHVKSIFKVLSKKYEVEKANPNTEWKLFNYLSFLDKKDENSDNADFEGDDNEEFVELLEVNDEYCSDDEEPNTSGGSFSESLLKNPSVKSQHAAQIPPEIQIRKIKNDKSVNTEKKDSKNGTIKKVGTSSSENGLKISTSAVGPVKNNDQILRKSASPNSIVVRIPAAANKNNSLNNQEKKTQSTITSSLKLGLKKDDKQKQTFSNLKEVKLKRKIENTKTEKDGDDPPIKRQIVFPKGIKVLPTGSKSITSKTVTPTSNEIQQQSSSNDNINSNFMPISPTDKLPPFSSLLKKSPTGILKDQDKLSPHQKQEHEHQVMKVEKSSSQQSSLISCAILSNKMNGIDAVRKDFTEKGEATLEIEQISKDADENTEIKVKVLTEQAEKILPTFFRDLYNSKKYDSFGMYVSSTMNRLPLHLASKLEAKILQSIIEINAMVDEHNMGDM